jgi:hypothetical protein
MRVTLCVFCLLALLAVLAACTPAPLPPTTTSTPLPPTATAPAPAINTPSVTSTPTLSYTATPVATVVPTAELVGQDEPNQQNGTLFLPIVGLPIAAMPDEQMTATATPSPTFTPTPSPTPVPTVDFTAVSATLEAQGMSMGYSKIGFHTGPGGNREGLDVWMRRQTEAGLPLFLKSVGDAGPLYEAQQLRAETGVPHTLVFRHAGHEWDTPNYDLPPAEAARRHWDLHVQAWPPELDTAVVWLETINEVDKNRSEWLAQFALETAQLALRDGRKWAAFGWSSGEPEPEQWETPAMLAFLRLAGQHPDQIAIALHEYSYVNEDITDAYPYRVGRFQQLLAITDKHNIPRPTILITEWGWTYDSNPPIPLAIQHIDWAARLYAPYPEVKGAAIWYLGGGFQEIANDTQQLIEPVTIYNLTHYYPLER